MSVHRFILVGLLSFLVSVPATLLAAPGVQWAHDLESARVRASQSRKLIVLHFTATWCPPCKQMEHEVFSRGDLGQALAENYVLVKVDVDRHRDLMKQYKVQKIPADVVITPSGQLISQSQGGMSADEYLAHLNQVAKGQNRAPSSLQTNASLAASPASPAAQPGGQPVHRTGGNTVDVDRRLLAPTDTSATVASANLVGDRYAPNSARYAANPQSGSLQGNPAPVASPKTQGPYGGSGQPGHSSPYSAQPRVAADVQGPDAARPTATQPGTAPHYGAGDITPQSNGVPQHWAQQQTRSQQHSAPHQGAQQQTAGYAAGPDASFAASQGASFAASHDASYAAGAPPRKPLGMDGNCPVYLHEQREWKKGDKQVWAEHEGVVYYFASSAHRHRFLANPNVYLKALDGFCPVHLSEQREWKHGDPRYGALHRGQIYLFSGQDEQRKFLANPHAYVAAGHDLVIAREQGRLVPGRRNHGLYLGKRVFLFSSEATLQAFQRDPQRYLSAVR